MLILVHLLLNLLIEDWGLRNNVGKCPWVGHLSELVTHQTICDKTMKILEENNKKIIKTISKRFSYDKNYDRDKGKDNIIFRSEVKKGKISKDTETMINNLKKEKENFFDNTNAKKRELKNEKEKQEFKRLFS